MKFIQLIIGPAGAGKTTYCNIINEHINNFNLGSKTSKRILPKIVNLDPASEDFNLNESKIDINIKDLISLEDVMEEYKFGPNGGLVFCMEYLINKLDWLENELNSVCPGDDGYFLFDCPGQIELFTHMNIMTKLCNRLQQLDYRLCGVFLLDSVFLDDPSKYISGTLMTLSSMIQIEIPFINIISKCDLIKSKEKLDSFLQPNTFDLKNKLDKQFKNKKINNKFKKLNNTICKLLSEFSMVNFFPLNANDEDSINNILANIDLMTNYTDEIEPRDPLTGDFLEDDEF